MQSIELIRDNLVRSTERVLARVEDMRDHAFVPPTPNGGGHTLWVLGHLAFIEGLAVREFMLGEANPLGNWKETFDSDGDGPSEFPPFDEVLERCRAQRASTLALVDSFTEADLDLASTNTPGGYEDIFGTRRLCLQYMADHWYMHRGQLAAARRAARIDRMWV